MIDILVIYVCYIVVIVERYILYIYIYIKFIHILYRRDILLLLLLLLLLFNVNKLGWLIAADNGVHFYAGWS